jgi:hypothetical protein
MQISTTELAQARDTLNQLLDELGLPVYRFEVEPDAESWLLIIECEAAEGWLRTRLETSRDTLRKVAAGDPQARQALSERLDALLSDCLRVA